MSAGTQALTPPRCARGQAENIANTDAMSAPDPLAVLYERTSTGFVEIGRTEVICA
jgi:hypothetical protein